MSKHGDENDEGNDPTTYAKRLRRDIARLRESQRKRDRAPRSLRSPELESAAHADTINAVREGRLLIDASGEFAPAKGEDRETADLPISVGAKIAGYKAAGMPMARVPAALRLRAKALAHLLDVVASSDEAPAGFIDRVTRAVNAALDVGGAREFVGVTMPKSKSRATPVRTGGTKTRRDRRK